MNLERKQKIVLFIGLAFVFVAGVFLIGVAIFDRDVAQSIPPEKEELTGAAAFSAQSPSGYWFLLDQWGYSSPSDGDDTPVRMTVAAGTEVPVGAGVNEYADFDPARVKITVSGSGGERVLETAPRNEGGMIVYVATYVPEAPGKEMITIEILGTSHKEFIEVSTYAKELLSETRLIREDVSWKGKWSGSVDTVKPSSGKLEDKGAPWELDEPGYLRIRSIDELTRTEGELKIYDISALKQHRNGEPLPYFFEHILKLEKYLTNQEKFSLEEQRSLYGFPPVNAVMRQLNRDQLIRGVEFDGVSYIHAGYFQAYDPAQQPTYIFQGISHDKKFFVYFTQELYSEDLRKYLRKNDWCVEKECIEGSFELLQHDQNLDPSPDFLNELMQSVVIRKP